MGHLTKKVLFDERAIAARVAEIGREISTKYPEGNVLLIGILKGAFMFMADLVRSISVSCQVDFVRISSYKDATVSSGKLDILLDVGMSVENRNVILVDDIVDSGLTLSEYKKKLLERKPRTLELAALVNKTGRREKHVDLDYCGFKIEEGFIVGYGLDCDEQDRCHGSLYVLEDDDSTNG
ncbi:hypoxanthine phosphoribosyltransferase [Desulfomonile tiedjei]|uniref:Hypoxanthine phosphoribosyltransferase n=1 Tax=Desulfomonile tiedjei (strain ATCC 49306 / DSM 6799 / DCB-1) TaxID=706587 RepID=I4C7I7_DESTA|nr:hypoxanthine phosphoribosyltransferase [Desulfomonile tiedjei]AFM25528.1 hypoxanthine phosphoribosyltransferase [Desulfomonile tiedjei DSM 6799]